MAGLEIPTNELVAEAWVRKMLPDLTARVAGSLPDPAAWADELGFIVVSSAGGSPHPSLPIAQPVVSLNAYATTGASSRQPPWGIAGRLLSRVRGATWAAPLDQRVPLRAPFADVKVLEATLVTEPRKIPGDASGYARFTADLYLRWII